MEKTRKKISEMEKMEKMDVLVEKYLTEIKKFKIRSDNLPMLDDFMEVEGEDYDATIGKTTLVVALDDTDEGDADRIIKLFGKYGKGKNVDGDVNLTFNFADIDSKKMNNDLKAMAKKEKNILTIYFDAEVNFPDGISSKEAKEIQRSF